VRRHPGALAVGGFILLVSLLFVMGGVWDTVLVLVALSLVVPMMLLLLDYWLRYGSIEYRVSGDAIVAYDRLFRTRLWRIEPWDESGLRIEQGRLDGVLDTSTVVIECSEWDLRLPHVRNPDPIIDVFDRRVSGG
jgi:hypothetical protein